MYPLMKLGAVGVASVLIFSGLLPSWSVSPAIPSEPQETHLRNIRQLTFEGENAEAYFSFDGTRLIFQSTSRSGGCDQIYTM